MRPKRKTLFQKEVKTGKIDGCVLGGKPMDETHSVGG
jgi:hypothetical protein